MASRIDHSSFPRPPHLNHSDTPYASSDPSTNDSEPQEQSQPKTRQGSLSKAPRTRAFSTASSTTSIRRKPLPLDASPSAVQFSAGERLATTVELPPRAFARPFDVDSPTVYDFITSDYHSPPSPTPELPEPDSDSSSAR